jgi:hypothetical protein
MYDPQVNDYVIWNRPNGDIEQGWIYFKGDELEKKKGFKECPRYLTIEVAIREKKVCETEAQLGKKNKHQHKYIHTLLLCNSTNWSELKYVKSRQNAHSTEYFQRTI